MSEDERGATDEPDGLLAEASLWFGRMRGPEAEAHQPDFDAWLARGALHRAFYNRVGEIYAMGKFLKEEVAGDAPADRGNAPDPNALHRPRRIWLWASIMAALCLTIATAVGLSFRPLTKVDDSDRLSSMVQSADIGRQLATADGQTLRQVLPDGSIVSLGANSALDVTYGGTARTLTLRRGRARFEVAHEPRPFIVFAGRGSVTARGTIFDVVRLADASVRVRLVRGRIDVAVRAPGAEHPAIQPMRAGEEMTYAADGSKHSAVAATPANAAPSPAMMVAPAPGDDMRDFIDAPLSEVVAAANRSNSTAIRLATSDLAGLTVTGRLRLGDPERLGRKLATIFGLQLDVLPSGDRVLRHRP